MLVRIALLIALIASTTPLEASAKRIFSRDGLTVDMRTRGGSHWFAQSKSQEFQVRYRGDLLCGPEIALLLHPNGAEHLLRRHYCPTQVTVLGEKLLIMFSASAASTPAVVDTDNGELRVEVFHTSPNPARDHILNLTGQRVNNPGWISFVSAWNDTVLVQKQPWKITQLGEGKLLDIEDSIAYLIVQPAHQQSDAALNTPRFRAVSVESGEEVASLKLHDPCLGTPRLLLEDGAAYPDADDPSVLVRYEDIPAWRRSTLALTPSADGYQLILKPQNGLRKIGHCQATD